MFSIGESQHKGATAFGCTKLLIQYIVSRLLYVEVVSPVSYHQTRQVETTRNSFKVCHTRNSQ